MRWGLALAAVARPDTRMQTMRQMVVAVLGTGSAGKRHLGALTRAEGARAVAIPVRSQRVAQLRGEGVTVVSTLAEAVADGARAAIIATDTSRHMEDALAAIRVGLHVLVEKPLAPTADEARPMLEEARRTGHAVAVGCVLRFAESLSAFRAWLPRIGRVHTVQIACQSYLPEWRPDRPYRESYSARAEEGGVLRDLIHEIDAALWLFGAPAIVRGRLRNLGRLAIASEEIAEASWETPEGAVVTVLLDYLTRPPVRNMRACGEHGIVEWNGIQHTVTLIEAGRAPETVRSAQSRDDLFAQQAEAFIAVVQGEQDARLATGEDGCRALVVCDAIRRASQKKAEERVEYR